MLKNEHTHIATETSGGNTCNGSIIFNEASHAPTSKVAITLPSRVLPYLKHSTFDLSAGDPDQFPIAAFPQIPRTVAENMAQVYQTPICLSAMTALAVLSGAVGKTVTVRGGYKDKATCLNLYVIPVAERGSGKGVVGETLCKPMAKRSNELAKHHRQFAANSRGEMGVLKKEIQRLEQQAASAKGPERDNLITTLESRQQRMEGLEMEAACEKTLLVGDTTSEALGKALQDNGEAVLSYSAEAGAAVQVALGKYSDNKGDYDLLLSGYSGDAVRTGRITRKSVLLENPCLSLLWLVQPCIIRQLFGDPEAFSRGLTARPLIFDSGSRREKDNRSTAVFEYADTWSSFIDSVLDRRLVSESPLEIACSPEAREVFAKFHDESIDLERGEFADLTGELSRWRENGIKVAGLFAIAEEAGTVSAEIAERAVRVVRWVGFNYLGLLQAGRKERQQKELERVLEVLNDAGGSINIGDLAKRHSITRERLMAVMAAHPGELSLDKVKTNGRPGEVLRLSGKATKATKGVSLDTLVGLVGLPEGSTS